MPSRREFLRNMAGATLGLGALQAPPPARRRAMIGGRPITVVDVHAHTFVPEVWDLVRNTPLAAVAKNNLTGPIALGPGMSARLAYMDREGIDYQAINVNAWGYSADRALARDLIQLQNEKIAEAVARHPDRLVGMATVALQHPDMAAEQLDVAARKLGMRGAAIGGSVEGQEVSDRRFDPFWAKAEELGVMLFMHPQQAPGTTQNALRICAAHAGGYLPSYLGRSDARCRRGPGGDCPNKAPSEYFKRELFIDTMIFHDDGLRHLVAEVGVGQMVYGTDYPFDWPVGIDFILSASFLSDADKTAILGGNLIKALRLAS
ncbi:MAG: amidohydrolase family protein [Acidobacteria bacterium]|nr:amidohydrolase family protein [Acidobacteriota bacterium]